VEGAEQEPDFNARGGGCDDVSHPIAVKTADMSLATKVELPCQSVPPIPWGHCFLATVRQRRISRNSIHKPTGGRSGCNGHGANRAEPSQRGGCLGTTAHIQAHLGGRKRPALKPLIFEPGQYACDFLHSPSSAKRHADCTKVERDQPHTGRIRTRPPDKSRRMHVIPDSMHPVCRGSAGAMVPPRTVLPRPFCRSKY
jgi:hypothetical protein